MQNFNKIFSAFIVILLVFVGLFVYLKLAGPIPFSVSTVSTVKNDVFTVSGEGKAVVKPDIAYVTVGIQANGSTVKSVQTQINTTINKVIAALKSLGIDEKDIKTTNYNINPTYDWTSGRQRITGYNASTNLQVKVRDLDKINDCIDQATAAGANQVGGIAFDVDDKSAAEEEARKEAVAEAKKKAQEAAQITGFKLGKIINYTENTGGYPRPIVAYDQMKLSAPALAGGGTEVQPGSSEITVNVTLSYQIE